MELSIDNDVVILESSDSGEEDIFDSETVVGTTRPHQNEILPDIRSRIERARALLENAEILSRPEQGAANSSQNRYDISRNVTARDFYHESELALLCDVASTLRMRLNVERIYNLGRPQCSEEQQIFDELLVSHFSELVSNESNLRPLFERDGDMSYSSRVQVGVNSGDHGDIRSTIDDNDISMESANVGTNPTENHENEQQSSTNISATSENEQSLQPVSHIEANCLNFSTTKTIMESVQKLRLCIDQNPQNILSNSETVTALSEFVQALKKSKVLSSIVSSPTTPSKTKQFSRKRQRSVEESCDNDPEKEKDDGTDDEESCSICLEPWTSGGIHRICCLKCGHIFGYSCIAKWIKQAQDCPQCKMPAKKEDIRGLFTRKLMVEDTSERDRALRLLEEEKTKTRNLEHKEALARRQADVQSRLISSLEARLIQIESGVSKNERMGAAEAVGACSSLGGGIVDPSVSMDTGSNHRIQSSGKKYQLLARINITQDGNCRVFEYSKELGMTVVSTKSTNALFRGFGIKTLSRDFRVLSYQPLHSALIKDMSFRPNTFDGTLLSCGMDKVIQLTSVTSKCVIQKFTMTASGWCCAWHPSNNNLFYVGMERGLVKEFDVRRTDSHTQDVLDMGGAPIASISYWDGQSQNGRSIQGLLIAQLRNLIFREKTEDQFCTHFLPCSQAPMMGVCLNSSGYFLTSFRPGASNPRCQYEVYRLASGQSENGVSSSKVTSWEGSTQQAIISRNALFAMPETNDHLLAATANHMDNKVTIWDIQRRRERQTLNCFNRAIDIKPISSNQQDLLGVLCESELGLYKWS